MNVFRYGDMAYLQDMVVPKELENTSEGQIFKLLRALVEHPEDEFALKHQLLIYLSVMEPEEGKALAEEMLAKQDAKKYHDDCYFTLARYYADENDIPKAIEYYRKTIAENPTIDEAITELAEIYEKQFDYDKAFEVYTLLDNDDIMDGKENMYRNHANIHYNKQEFDKALDCYQKALALYPEDKDGWISESIGETYWQKSNIKKAWNGLRKLCIITPNLPMHIMAWSFATMIQAILIAHCIITPKR